MNDLTKFSVDELIAYSITELTQLQNNVAKAIELRKETDKKKLLDDFAVMAKASGFTLNELMQEKLEKEVIAKNKKPRMEAKYRHPTNSELIWSGHGRKPEWIKTLLNAGTTLDELKC